MDNLKKKLIEEIVVSDSLTLVSINPAHATSFLNVIIENQVYFSKTDFNAPKFTTRTEVLKAIEQLIQRKNFGYGISYGLWNEAELLGFFNINSVDWNDNECNIGYWLKETSTKKGFAYLALNSLIQTYRKKLKIYTFTAHTAVTNLNSQKLLSKLGFVNKETIKSRAPIKGRIIDDYLFQLDL
jgi:RimJ/RimL family protein N-acetyltransferase